MGRRPIVQVRAIDLTTSTSPLVGQDANCAVTDETPRSRACSCRPNRSPRAERHPELGRLRLVVTREADVITLKAECTSPNDALQDQLAASLRAVTKLGGNVELVPIGALPNDGRVIGTNAERIATANQIGFVLPLILNSRLTFDVHGRWPKRISVATVRRAAPVMNRDAFEP